MSRRRPIRFRISDFGFWIFHRRDRGDRRGSDLVTLFPHLGALCVLCGEYFCASGSLRWFPQSPFRNPRSAMRNQTPPLTAVSGIHTDTKGFRISDFGFGVGDLGFRNPRSAIRNPRGPVSPSPAEHFGKPHRLPRPFQRREESPYPHAGIRVSVLTQHFLRRETCCFRGEKTRRRALERMGDGC